MKFIFNKSEKELPAEARKALAPRKEFIEKGRDRFLAAFDASAMAREKRATTGPVTSFFKIAVGAMALLCIATSVSVYADTANVTTNNILYPLKRASENVRLALALPAQKPEIQASFAVRRAGEISALEASNPTSTLIPQLTTDLDTDIQQSLGATIGAGDNGNHNGYGRGHGRDGKNGNSGGVAVNGTTTASSTLATNITPTSTDNNDDKDNNNEENTLNVYCKAFDTSTSGVLIARLENELSLHPSAWAKFNARCAPNANTTTTATTTVSASSSILLNATTTATTTAQSNGRNHNGNNDDRAYVRGILQVP